MTRATRVYYDGGCAVCATEIGLLARGDRDGALCAIDIAAPDFDAARHGFDPRALDAALHAVLPDGSVVQGMAALRALYASAGWGTLLAPTAWPGLRPLFDAGYHIFARHRRPISRALAPWLRRRAGAPR